MLGALLAAAVLLILPAAHGLELHHADHRARWIASDPATPELMPSETGATSEPSCPLCLASGQARGEALAPSGSSPIGQPALAPMRAAGGRTFLPTASDPFVAGPRAPPQA